MKTIINKEIFIMGNIAKWKQLSEEEFAKLVEESRSYYELAEKIGYKKEGGSTQAILKQVVKERGLDDSHFLGQGWNKKNYDYKTFSENSPKKNGKTTLAALLNIREYKCECCGNSEWLGQKIPLEIHHIDGDHYNNSLDNLQLLCLNCHALTPNFRGRNNTGKIKVSEEEFVEALKTSSSIAQALKKCGLSLGSGNYKRANELIVKYQISKFLV